MSQSNDQETQGKSSRLDPRKDPNSPWYGMPEAPKLDFSDFESTGEVLDPRYQKILLQQDHTFKFEYDWLKAHGHDAAAEEYKKKYDSDKAEEDNWAGLPQYAWGLQQGKDGGRILNSANTKKKAADVKVGDDKDEESKPEASVMREEEGVGKGGKSSSSSAEGDPLIKRKKAAADMLGFK